MRGQNLHFTGGKPQLDCHYVPRTLDARGYGRTTRCLPSTQSPEEPTQKGLTVITG